MRYPSPRMTARPPSRARWVVLLVVAAVALPACSSTSKNVRAATPEPSAASPSPTIDPRVTAANAAVAKATAAAVAATRRLSADFTWVKAAVQPGRGIGSDPAKISLFPVQRKAVSGPVNGAHSAINRARKYAKARPRDCGGVASERAAAYSKVHDAESAYAVFTTAVAGAQSGLRRAARDRPLVSRAMARLTVVLKSNPQATNQPRIESLLSSTYTAPEQAALLAAVHRAQATAGANLTEAHRLSAVAGTIARRCG